MSVSALKVRTMKGRSRSTLGEGASAMVNLALKFMILRHEVVKRLFSITIGAKAAQQ
jgi:hypothetical protein